MKEEGINDLDKIISEKEKYYIPTEEKIIIKDKNYILPVSPLGRKDIIFILLTKRTALEHLNSLEMGRNEGEEYQSTNETILNLKEFLDEQL
jgi:hypothetical protein